MPENDLMLRAGVDLGGLEADFRRMTQMAAEAGQAIARAAGVTIPGPAFDVSAFTSAGITAGHAFADGLSEAVRAVQADVTALRSLAGDLRIGGATDADLSALREMLSEAQRVAQGTEGARSAVQALGVAMRELDEASVSGGTGLRAVERALTEIEATAQRVRAAPVVGATLAGASSGIDTTAAQRAAAQEVAARQQIASELQREIGLLGLRARTLDVGSGDAVRAFQRELGAMREQAGALNLTQDALLRIDATAQQVARRVAQAQRAAARAAQADAPPIGLTNLPALTSQIGAFTRAGRTGANAALGIAFALEGIATGASNADTKMQSALRVVSTLGLALGPEGILVSALAQGTSALIGYFDQARKEAEKTRKAFADEFAHLADDFDPTKVQQKLQQLTIGQPSKGASAFGPFFQGGISDLQAQITAEQARLDEALRQRNVFAYNAARKHLEELRAQLDPLQKQFDQLAALALNPPAAVRPIRGLPTVDIRALSPDAEARLRLKLDTKDAEATLRAFRERMEREPIAVRLTPGENAASILAQSTAPHVNRAIPLDLDTERVKLGLRDVEAALQALHATEQRLDFTRLFGDPAAVREAEQAVQATGSAARTTLGLLLPLLGAIKDPASRNAALAQAAQWAQELSRAVGPARREMDALGARVSAGARGVAEIADAFGHVDDTLHRAIRSGAQFVEQLTTAAATMQRIQDTDILHGGNGGLGALFSSAEGIGATLSAIGAMVGALSTVQGLFSRGPSAAEIEQQRVIAANTEEMARLRDVMRGFGDNTAATARALLVLANPVTSADSPRVAVDLAEAQRLIKALGINLQLIDSTGHPAAGALTLLREAAATAADRLTHLSDTFDDQRRNADIERRLFNLPDTPTAHVTSDLSILRTLAPELFKGLPTNLTGATAAERAAIRAFFQWVYTEAKAGRITVEQLGKIPNVDALTGDIGIILDDMDLFDKGLRDATQALGNVPQAFKRLLDADRFRAMSPQLPTGPVVPTYTPAPTPTPRYPTGPTPGAGLPPQAGPVTTVYHFDNITVIGSDRTAEELFDDITAEARRRGLARGGVNDPAAMFGLLPRPRRS
jgi:hypothetical protein